jgi:hypothetical protein
MLIIIVIVIILRLCKIYYNAKEKHRNEMIQPVLFFGQYTLNLPFVFPRAFMSCFSLFECNYFGISFHGVAIIIKNDRGEILIGKRAGDRAKKWLFDIGAAGMVAGFVNDENIIKNALCELKEETGINATELKFIKRLMPCDGYPCIVHCFSVNVLENVCLVSEDGTYEEMFFMEKSNAKKYIDSLDIKCRRYSKCTELLLSENLIIS